LNAIGESLSDLATSEDGEDGEDKDDNEEDTGHGKLSEDDEPGWMMGTISKMVLDSMESFQQKDIRLDEPTQPGWRDAAEYLCERDMKYGMTELNVPAVGKPNPELTAAIPSPTTLREFMQAVDNVAGQSHMPQVTSRQGRCQMRLGLEKPQADNLIVPPMPAAVPDLSQIEIGKPVRPVSFYPCM
jgi:hypothetical protein